MRYNFIVTPPQTAQAVTAHHVPVTPVKLYFANSLVDYLLAGGASILAYLYFRFSSDLSAVAVSQFVIIYLVWLGNAPHFAATSYRLYGSRETLRQYPCTAALIPLAVLMGIAASLRYPTHIAPYFVKLYLLWSPYHYSGQTVGLSLIYARRHGIAIGKWERLSLSGFVYGTFIAATAFAETQVTNLTFFGISYPTLGLPAVVAQGARVLMYGSGALFLAFAWRWAKANGRRVPLIVFLPSAAQYVWLVLGSETVSYFQLVPFFHGVQYLLVAWYVQADEAKRRPGGSSKWPIPVATLKWSVLNILGGIALFAGFPKLISLFSSSPILFIAPIAIAGVQIHHFFVDGVIWKLRNPRVSSSLVKALVVIACLTFSSRAAFADAPKLSNERIVLRTTLGDLVIALYPEVAPGHAAQLLKLARLGVYDTTQFFKVDPAFALQVGGVARRRAPLQKQQADALHPLIAEFSSLPHRYGTVTMAHDPGSPDTAQMSFLIMLADVPQMDGKFTVVGEVVGGKDTLDVIRTVPTDNLQQPMERIEIESAFVVESAERMNGVELRKTAPSFTPAREPMPPWLAAAALLLLGAGIALSLLSIWVMPRWNRAVGFLSILGGFFLLFALLVPSASASPPLAIGLFVAALAVFKLMNFFESGMALAEAAPPSAGPRARDASGSGGSAPYESSGKRAPKSR